MPDVILGVKTTSIAPFKALTSALETEASASMARINRILEAGFRTNLGNNFSGGFGKSGVGFDLADVNKLNSAFSGTGPAVRAARVEFDQLANSARILGQVGINLGNEFMPIGWAQSAISEGSSLIAAIQRIRVAQVELNKVTPATETTPNNGSALAAIQAPYLASIEKRSQVPVRAESERLQALKDLYIQNGAEIPKNINTMYGKIQGALANNENGIIRQQTKMNAAVSRVTKAANNEMLAAEQQLQTAYNTPPPIHPNIMATLQSSPQLQQQLLKAGLGGGAAVGSEAFKANVASANFNAPYLDMVKGVTKVSGEFDKTLEDGTTRAVRFGAEIDKSGKVLTRFGGQLSGASSFLNQIGRDFVKVAEWTIATTAIIGGIGAIFSTIKSINEIDKLLQRVGITAQMTTAQSREYFATIADVAYKTATPLNEMLGAMDDIALATKKTGQTTAEWTSEMTALATSVGILTNIAGITTVEATDNLTAAMKQMGLQATDMINILNMVTAVASGQASAIAEITKGLSVMAETAKTAGLSIPQSIGTLQVLGQVTGKSASEVAVSFKNLVGSIDSAGSIKVLKEFGIQVKDAQGNARNFLDIYGDIANAISTGVIPAGQVKAVEKAIAGGPRRAPDAAALVANVSSIYDQETIAINSSSDALLANAKILQSNSAQLTQLKVKIDALTFEKFAVILRSAVTDLSGALQTVIDFIGQIPTGWVEGAVKVLAFVAAMKLVSIGIKLIVGLFESLNGVISSSVARMVALGVAAKSAAAGTVAASEGQMSLGLEGAGIGGAALTGTGLGAGAGALGKSVLGKLGGVTGASLIGGTVAQMMGGSLGQTIGGAMISAAGGMALTGVGLPLAAAVGVIGTSLVLLTGETKAATQELNTNTEAILSASTAWITASDSAQNLTDKQTTLLGQINDLSSLKDVDSIQARADAQTQLADISSQLITTNVQLTQSYTDLMDALSKGTGVIGNLNPDLLAAVQSGRATADQILEIKKELQLAYLQAAYPDQYTSLSKGLTGNMPVPSYQTDLKAGTTIASSPWGKSLQGDYVVPPKTPTIDLAQADITKLMTLFQETPTGLKLVEGIPNNLTTSNILWGVFNTLSAQGASNAKDVKQALIDAGFAFGDLTQAAQGYIQLQAYLNTEGILKGMSAEDIKKALGQYQFAQSMMTSIGSLPESQWQVGMRYNGSQLENEPIPPTTTALKTITQNPTQALFPDSQQWKDVVAEISQMPNMSTFAKWDLSTQAQMIKNLGGNVAYYGYTATKAAEDAQALGDATEALATAADSLNKSLDNTSASLLDQYLAGSLTKTQYGDLAERQKKLQSLSDAFNLAASTNPIMANTAVPEGTIKSWDEFTAKLSKTPGFEHAATMSMKDLLAAMVDYALKTNLTSAQVKFWTDAIKLMTTALLEVPSNVQTNIGVHTVYTSEGTPAFTIDAEGKKHPGGPAKPAATTLPQWAIDLQNAVTALQNLSGTQNQSTSKSSGSSGGSTAASVAGTVEIPQAWIDSGANIQELMKKAIAWAEKYQKAVPGAEAAAKGDIVAVMEGNTRVMLTRNVSESALSAGIAANTAAVNKQNDLLSKADTIRRIRVGSGDFAALANVPTNSKTGVSVGGPQGPITVNLNITGQILTPAQTLQIGNAIAAAIGSNIGG